MAGKKESLVKANDPDRRPVSSSRTTPRLMLPRERERDVKHSALEGGKKPLAGLQCKSENARFYREFRRRTEDEKISGKLFSGPDFLTAG